MVSCIIWYSQNPVVAELGPAQPQFVFWISLLNGLWFFLQQTFKNKAVWILNENTKCLKRMLIMQKLQISITELYMVVECSDRSIKILFIIFWGQCLNDHFSHMVPQEQHFIKNFAVALLKMLTLYILWKTQFLTELYAVYCVYQILIF